MNKCTIQQKEPVYSFQQKGFNDNGMISLAVVVLLLPEIFFSLLMLIVAGAPLATFFRGLAGVEKKTRWFGTVCLLI